MKMSSVRRSRRPDAAQAAKNDAVIVPNALRRFIALYQSFLPAPDNLFSEDQKKRLEILRAKMRRAALSWCRSAPLRGATWDENVFPRLAYRENGRLLGFDFLRVHVPGAMQDWSDDLPMALDSDGMYSTLSSFATFAFLLQNDLWNCVSPRIDLHVLTKGVREFNTDGNRPNFMKTELVTYVHTAHNLDAYISALIESDAFRAAARSPLRPGASMRRIVVPILLTGHYQVFGWDRVPLPDGNVHDRLFVMTSMPQTALLTDPKAADNIMRELCHQLVAGGFVSKTPEITPYPGAGHAMRAITFSEPFRDAGCFYVSMLYTFFLAMAEDINAPNEAFLQPSVWNAFRAGCEVYQRRTVGLLEAHADIEAPVLLGPSWDAKFINIRDARLASTDGTQYAYSSGNGWTAS
jgi:hypothetical protein